MQGMVVGSAKRHSEFVADFSSQCAWLSELQVMRICGGLPTDETTLAAHESEVILASPPRRLFWEGESDLLSG
ncbi:hypothetical protein XF30_32260 [Bradyrhizobium sp. SUTN9-2]|nr:hypothetical protein XF30_32260 [Bradyrhizobium sp. SUTN9-2]